MCYMFLLTEVNPFRIGFGSSKHADCYEAVESRTIAEKGEGIDTIGRLVSPLVRDRVGVAFE